MEYIVKAENVIYEYEVMSTGTQKVMALNGVTLNMEKGKFIAVIGRNGSGKSTFARHINALLYPTGGTVWIDGKNTKDEDELWNIRRSAGMIFQNPDNQIIGTTVEEDIGFGPENIGLSSEEILNRVDKALKLVGMEKLRNFSPNRLSGGQKQRVAIAGVLAMHPKCIIMDEPTSMLDPAGRKEVLEVAHRLNRDEGVTIILITHNMDEVTGADRVFVMNDGKVAMEGSPGEIFMHAEEMAGYGLELPQPVEIALKLNDRGIRIKKDILTMDELASEIYHIYNMRK